MQEFKLIVAGGRDFDVYGALREELTYLATEGTYKDHAISIVSGMARGADALAVRFAKEHDVKLYEFHANWDKYGKGAGYRRNEDMARFADGLLAFFSNTKGTAHMIECMRRHGKPVHIVNY